MFGDSSSLKLFYFTAAVLAFCVGYEANPFGQREVKVDVQQIEKLYQKTLLYQSVGNLEGAEDLAQQIHKQHPGYKNVEGLLFHFQREKEVISVEKSQVQRLPAALRDSWYDANIAFKEGKCREAYENMRPVSRYLKNKDDLMIFKSCRLTQEQGDGVSK